MSHRTSLPILGTLLIFAAACGGVDVGPTGGAGGGGNTGSGSTGTGDVGGGGSGTGGACVEHQPMVYACAHPDPAPANPSEPWAFTNPGTVTAVRAPDAAEPCASNNIYQYQFQYGVDPEVMIDLADATGNKLTVGFKVPGFTASDVAVGDSLVVDFAAEIEEWGGKTAHLVVARNGQLVVAVGENHDVGLTVTEGKSECYSESDLCGREEFEISVQASGGPAVSIPNGASADVSGLMVTNEHYFHNYDTSGGCNFGLSTEYLVGVAPAP